MAFFDYDAKYRYSMTRKNVQKINIYSHVQGYEDNIV